MGKYCPRVNKEVVYLTCQECDEKMCEMELKPSCSTCNHKRGTTQFCGTEVTICELTNRLIQEYKVKIHVCECHNKDLSQEDICFACQHFGGGGDWGLAWHKHYHRLPEALSPKCEDFERKVQDQ